MARSRRADGTAPAAVVGDVEQVVREPRGSWSLKRMPIGRVSLVGAGPGDPELWTVRALRRVQAADLVLYDALVDGKGLQQLTKAQCFCVGKRAGRASVQQATIQRLMIRAARAGKRVFRLEGCD